MEEEVLEPVVSNFRDLSGACGVHEVAVKAVVKALKLKFLAQVVLSRSNQEHALSTVNQPSLFDDVGRVFLGKDHVLRNPRKAYAVIVRGARKDCAEWWNVRMQGCERRPTDE